MLAAAKHLRALKYGDDVIVDVPVSVDGSWQKRYGHNSILGMVFVMSIDTGHVLDYSVKSLYCFKCKKNPNASVSWKEKHAESCSINHAGISGAMEKDGAVEIFTLSVEKHNLRYTVYVGDGVSGSFGAIKEALADKFGDEYPITKEDCIGHIQKRMGIALHQYKNNSCGTKLSDGKGLGGAGRLTDVIVDQNTDLLWLCYPQQGKNG